MPIYRVKQDYNHGKWIKDHPNPIVEVRAANEQEAAETVCGMKLRDKGSAAQYCAQVWPLGGARQPHEIAHFYLI